MDKMSISVNNANVSVQYTQTNYSVKSESTSQKTSVGYGNELEDTVFEKNTSNVEATYDDKISFMKADLASKTMQLQTLVQSFSLKQSSKSMGFDFSFGGDKNNPNDFISDIFNMSSMDGKLASYFKNLEVDEATSLQAQEDISENGFWGIEKTATRILDFAKALSGGDITKLGVLKDAVIKGFKQAGASWGEDLPEISQKTYDRVMQGFNDWAGGADEE
jgi:hypothetical protein